MKARTRSDRGPTRSRQKADEELADFLATCYDDPLRYVMAAFPWTTEASIQLARIPSPWREQYNSDYGPDGWACELLEQLGLDIRARGYDGQNAVDPIRFAVASGHGIGKTSLVSWVIKFILDTRPYARGVVTATTADQLKTKTWAELAKWHKLSFTEHWFKYSCGRGSMTLSHVKYPEQWRCDALTCKEENKEAFQGLHAANSTPFYVFDEASGVPDAIYEAREGGLTDGEPMVFDFGNPTRNSGEFFEHCEGRQKHRYHVKRIDSRSVQITNKSFLAQMIEDYGIESDRVKVKILGQFPSAGTRQFIGREEVLEAMQREIPERNLDPVVLGVDVARSGVNDSVIYPRQGDDARTWPPQKFSGLDNVQVAEKVVEMVRWFEGRNVKVQAIFVDQNGVGAGVVDILRRLGYPVIGVSVWSAATNQSVYYKKVDEMWGRMRDHIRTSLCLPSDHNETTNSLFRGLIHRESGYTKKAQITLDPKEDFEDMDIPDALSMTYAQYIASADMLGLQQQAVTVEHDYDPLDFNFEKEDAREEMVNYDTIYR